MPYQLLADVVLLMHFAVVLFVVLGLPAIVIGHRLGWRWTHRPGWRSPTAHREAETAKAHRG